MDNVRIKKRRIERRKKSIRKTISGTAVKPRLSVYRSNKYIYVQAIDDENGLTMCSASSLKIEGAKLNKETAKVVGKQLGDKLKSLNVEKAVFDRNGYIYTGRVKELADSIRSAGISF